MFIFGKHRWLRHGEAFSVVFGFLSRFSIVEVRNILPEVCGECSLACRAEDGRCVDCYECFEFSEEREFNLRPPAVGLHNLGRVTGDVMAMVILLLATVTFDGFSATPEWLEVQSYFLTRFPGLTSEVAIGVTSASAFAPP